MTERTGRPVSLPLDMASIHAVEASRSAAASSVNAGSLDVTLTLTHRAGDRRSNVHEAFARQLRVRAGDDTLRRFDETSRSVHVSASRIDLLLLDDSGVLPPLLVSTLSVDTNPIARAPLEWKRGSYRLSPFELRYAADTGRIHPVPVAARVPAFRVRAPITDLHSHFAGCVRGDELVRLAAEADLVYPKGLIEEAKIHLEGDVKIAELSPALRDRLARRLEVPLDRRVTFLEMEHIYRLRAPLTKAPSMLIPLCREIASDYAAMGVEYAELSLGDIVDTQVLRAIHEELPAIEDETGVTIRFLAAISRHDDPEWDQDLVERIKRLAGSVYVAGVDFMGHETNSTHVFVPVLRALASWADQARPGFVVRVHAGESPSHPENVRVAIDEAQGHAIELRIGHGLYGVDDPTLERIVKSGTIVEFNLDSNVALNHLQSARYVPLRRYVEAGANVVLGSDGYGIYQTTPAAAAQAALLCGLEPAHLDKQLARTEEEYGERVKKRDGDRAKSARSYIVPHDTRPIHFKPAVMARRRAEIQARDAAMAARLRELEVPVVVATDGDAFRHLVSRRAVISIAGAWKHSWEAMPPNDQAIVAREMKAFVMGLDPREAVLITGGTRFGVEGVVGRAAVERGLVVVAAIVRATAPDALERGTFTHACFVGDTLYDKAAGLYELVHEHDGSCIFVSGGQIVSDEIQTAKNLRIRHLLMAGIEGASARHAEEDPARSFRLAEEALHALREWRTLPPEHAPHWYVGPNPTVDAVIVRDHPETKAREVLLVHRDLDAPAEAGKWALPGGFVLSSEPRGGRWRLTGESEIEACAREIHEETGLTIPASRLVHLDIYEGGGRDPRDTALSWSRSTVYVVKLTPSEGKAAIAGGDDAADARWFPVDALPRVLAFDHAQIIEDAIATLKAGR